MDGGWAAEPSHIDPSRWPLVGRDDELVLATVALKDHGSVVLTGAAGVGKTRLAHEILACAPTRRDRTEWVAATHAAATVPLGAVAHLVPATALGHGRERALHGIVGALRREHDDGRLLLGIDDAHLLDDASAALVPLLVRGGTASVVATMRSGEPAPDAIVALWKDGPAPLIALQTLARAEVDTIVTTALDGAVEGATLHFLWESSAGNALVPARARAARTRVGRASARTRAVAVDADRSNRASGCRACSRRGWATSTTTSAPRWSSWRSVSHSRSTACVGSASPRSRRGWSGAAWWRPADGSSWRSRSRTRSSAKSCATASHRRGATRCKLALADAVEATCGGVRIRAVSRRLVASRCRRSGASRAVPQRGAAGDVVLGTGRGRAAGARRTRRRPRDRSGVHTRRSAERPEPGARSARCAARGARPSRARHDSCRGRRG